MGANELLAASREECFFSIENGRGGNESGWMAYSFFPFLNSASAFFKKFFSISIPDSTLVLDSWVINKLVGGHGAWLIEINKYKYYF